MGLTAPSSIQPEHGPGLSGRQLCLYPNICAVRKLLLYVRRRILRTIVSPKGQNRSGMCVVSTAIVGIALRWPTTTVDFSMAELLIDPVDLSGYSGTCVVI